MNIKTRTLILGAVLAVAVLVLALQVAEPVYVVLVVAVLALVGLVAWSRLRRGGVDEDEEWESGDEWGLSSDEADDDYVDLDDRLSGLGLDREMPSRRGLFAEETFDEDEVVWEDEGEEEYAEAAAYDEEYAEDEYAEEEYAEAEYAEAEYAEDEFVDESVYDTSALDEELEELVEEYAAEEAEEEPVARRTSSLFGAPAVIDEAAVKDDDSILAASEASSLRYEKVLSREDANAETREILSRVASLLAKYE